MTTTRPSIKIKSGKRHTLIPGNNLIAGKTFIGDTRKSFHFLIEQPNTETELKASGHLNTRFTTIDDLKKYCLETIDSSKCFNKVNEITIHSHASDDGGTKFNKDLSKRRSKAIELWIKNRFPNTQFEYKIRNFGESQADQTRTDENTRQIERRVDISVSYSELQVIVAAYFEKENEPPVLDLTIDKTSLINVQKKKGNSSEVEISYLDNTLDFSKSPGLLLRYVIKMLNIFQSDWPNDVVEEVKFMKNYIEDKYKERMATPL